MAGLDILLAANGAAGTLLTTSGGVNISVFGGAATTRLSPPGGSGLFLDGGGSATTSTPDRHPGHPLTATIDDLTTTACKKAP